MGGSPYSSCQMEGDLIHQSLAFAIGIEEEEEEEKCFFFFCEEMEHMQVSKKKKKKLMGCSLRKKRDTFGILFFVKWGTVFKKLECKSSSH